MCTEHLSAYRNIMKATSLFGGVQVFKIIIAVVRSKVLAILLGPMGMGIEGLLSSTTGLISSITNFGLDISAVRDVAAANESNNSDRIARIIAVFRKLVWFTGLLGAVLTFVSASLLSELSFGNSDYTYAFMWLSATLFINQLASGQNVLLQGLRKLKYLAKANLIGSSLSLVFSLPLYYFYGIDGIIPAMIISSLITFFFAWFYAKKIKVDKVKVSPKEVVSDGKSMLKMGVMLSLTRVITVGASYIIRIYISQKGDLDDVGLYQAGFAIIFSYVGLVFNAMATDYYPKLSGVAKDTKKAIKLINQQAEIGLLILAPILTIFLVFINEIVIVLYSDQFVGVNEMIHWAALGMYFKLASWVMAFLFLAKGHSKLFFWNELSFNIYMLGFNMLGYTFYGLEGLGVSFFVTYLLYLIQVFVLCKKKYDFKFTPHFYKLFGVQLSLGIACFMTMRLVDSPWNFIIGSGIILFTCIYSVIEMNKKIDLLGLLRKNK